MLSLTSLHPPPCLPQRPSGRGRAHCCPVPVVPRPTLPLTLVHLGLCSPSPSTMPPMADGVGPPGMEADDSLPTRDTYLIPKAQPCLLSCDVSAGQRVRGARGRWLLVALTGGVRASPQTPQKGWGNPASSPGAAMPRASTGGRHGEVACPAGGIAWRLWPPAWAMVVSPDPLGLSFLLCQVGIITVPTSGDIGKITADACRMFRTAPDKHWSPINLFVK